MNGFSYSVERNGASLHAAAHSHHPWPDVTLAAQEAAWRDAARLLDRKWAHVFGEIIPAAQRHIARRTSLPDPSTLTFGPNTHSLLLRILSCFDADRPIRVVTTSSEFHSFSRQISRMEEDNLVDVTRVSTEPFTSFGARFADAASSSHVDLVFFSHVFFDSGHRMRELEAMIGAIRDSETFVVIDGYHGFMAVPTDLGRIAERVFYLGGGYKYAMAGEGVCFLHCPPGYGARPRDTGWYAGFSALESSDGTISYATDGTRFLGSTFDVTGLYRFNAVQDWLDREGQTVESMLLRVRGLERLFLTELDRGAAPVCSADLLVPDEEQRGRFLAFRTPNAGAITTALAARNIIVDHRGDRLRIGLGIYHTEEDAIRLARVLIGLGL